MDYVQTRNYTIQRVNEDAEPEPVHMLCPGCCTDIDLLSLGESKECDKCALKITHAGEKLRLERPDNEGEDDG